MYAANMNGSLETIKAYKRFSGFVLSLQQISQNFKIAVAVYSNTLSKPLELLALKSPLQK